MTGTALSSIDAERHILRPKEKAGTLNTRTLILTLAALVAFAGNSVLCRMALKPGLIEPLAFAEIRFVSGAVMLTPFFFWRLQKSANRQIKFDLRPAIALFVYAIPFSVAYVGLDTGMGALILFAMAQVVMVGTTIVRGHHPSPMEGAGIALAFAGLIYLVSPGLSQPPLASAGLMAVAGIAWGAYSLFGQGVKDPILATAQNFIAVAPLMLLVFVISGGMQGATPAGIALALGSGMIASGLGYVLWYLALEHLRTTTAAVAQTSVPLIAALGGITFSSEVLSVRFVLASVAIIGGIVLTLTQKAR